MIRIGEIQSAAVTCGSSARSSPWALSSSRWRAIPAALAWRLWQFGPELLTCVARADVPPDNNRAERGMRPLVVGRKISGGTRSPRGSDTRMALYTLSATWTAQGHNPLHEFRRLLQSPLPQV